MFRNLFASLSHPALLAYTSNQVAPGDNKPRSSAHPHVEIDSKFLTKSVIFSLAVGLSGPVDSLSTEEGQSCDGAGQI